MHISAVNALKIHNAAQMVSAISPQGDNANAFWVIPEMDTLALLKQHKHATTPPTHGVLGVIMEEDGLHVQRAIFAHVGKGLAIRILRM